MAYNNDGSDKIVDEFLASKWVLAFREKDDPK